MLKVVEHSFSPKNQNFNMFQRNKSMEISRNHSHPLKMRVVVGCFVLQGRDGEESVGLPQHQRLLCGGGYKCKPSFSQFAENVSSVGF